MNILGIELGGKSIKAVELEVKFRRVEVVEVHQIFFSADSKELKENYQIAIRQLFTKLPQNPDKIVLSVPASHTALRFFEVPLKQYKKVEQSYKLELEENVPFRLEDAIIEHHITPSENGSLVFAALSLRKYLEQDLTWFKEIGVDPDWLVFEGMGAINLYLSQLQKKEQKEDQVTVEPVLLLDLGHLSTTVSVFSERSLHFLRHISFGGFNLTESLSHTLAIPLEEAEILKEKKVSFAVPFESSDMELAVVKAFASLFSEVSHCLMSYRSQYKKEVKRLTLTGGLALIPGISQFFESTLKMPVDIFDPWGQVKSKDPIEFQKRILFTESLGRAFVFNRQSELLFNFRKEELSKQNSLNEILEFLKNPGTIFVLKYLSITFIIFLFSLLALTWIQSSKVETLQAELDKSFTDVFKTVPKKVKSGVLSSPEDLKKFILNKTKNYKDKLKLLESGEPTQVGLLKIVSDALPPDVKLEIQDYSVEEKKVRLEGILKQGSLERATENLKKATEFKKVDLMQERDRFTFEMTLKGGG